MAEMKNENDAKHLIEQYITRVLKGTVVWCSKRLLGIVFDLGEDNAYANFWGQTKCIHGRCETGPFSGLLASSPGRFGSGAKPVSWLRTNFWTSIFQTFQTEVLKVLWSNVFWLNKPVPLSKKNNNNKKKTRPPPISHCTFRKRLSVGLSVGRNPFGFNLFLP